MALLWVAVPPVVLIIGFVLVAFALPFRMTAVQAAMQNLLGLVLILVIITPVVRSVFFGLPIWLAAIVRVIALMGARSSLDHLVAFLLHDCLLLLPFRLIARASRPDQRRNQRALKRRAPVLSTLGL